MVVLLGQHSGFTTYASVNSTPLRTIIDRTLGIAHCVSHRWSSLRMSTMLGFCAVARPPLLDRSPAVVAAPLPASSAETPARIAITSIDRKDRLTHPLDGFPVEPIAASSHLLPRARGGALEARLESECGGGTGGIPGVRESRTGRGEWLMGCGKVTPRGSARSAPAGSVEPAGQLGAGADPELSVDAGQVPLDGLHRQEQGRGRLLVGGAFDHHAGDAVLRRGERDRRRRPAADPGEIVPGASGPARTAARAARAARGPPHTPRWPRPDPLRSRAATLDSAPPRPAPTPCPAPPTAAPGRL